MIVTKKEHSSFKEPDLYGRYITNEHIKKCLEKINHLQWSVIGQSVEKRFIYGCQIGTGRKKVLMWSQMHGNESTTTKALFDLFHFLKLDNEIAKLILTKCSIMVIPILNPDGANRYTRHNANGVDLNRDAQALTQPESLVLKSVFQSFNPDYCFNLHGQRTIYGVGDLPKSSILSFLSPSVDKQRRLTSNRKEAMAIISSINRALQKEIPNGIGRYDDGFNLNCVGDTFQSLGVPTLLFEAGHFPNDYQREYTRFLMFQSILEGLIEISKEEKLQSYRGYFEIPDIKKTFYDVIIRNAKIDLDNSESLDIGFHFREDLIEGVICFVPVVETLSKLDSFFGHREIDAKGKLVRNSQNRPLEVKSENDFVILNNEKIALIP